MKLFYKSFDQFLWDMFQAFITAFEVGGLCLMAVAFWKGGDQYMWSGALLFLLSLAGALFMDHKQGE